MMVMILYVALGVIIIYCLLRRNTGKLKEIPGPMGLPLVGYGPFLTETGHEAFSDFVKEYGEIFKINVYGQTMVVLNSARLIRTAFSDDRYKKYMNDRAATFYGDYVYFGSQAIAFMAKAYDSDHSEVRKVFAKGLHFHGEGKVVFEDNVKSEISNVVEKLHKGNTFEMVGVFKRSLTNVISLFLSGHDLKDDDKNVNLFWDLTASDDYFLRPDVSLSFTLFPFLRFLPGRFRTSLQKAQEVKESIIHLFLYEKKATYKDGEIRGLVDYLIREQLQSEKTRQKDLFTDDKISVIILEIITAGLVTMLSSLSSLVLCLMNYPKIQEKIQAELDKVVGTDRCPELADRKSCVFTEAVIMEVQRYISIVPTLIPHFCRENIEFEGFEIPAKSMIIPNVWHVHHSTEVWGDPWTFRPERWLDVTGGILPNDHILRKNWLAFGNGRRQCPGESFARSRIFLYVATLLQKFSFQMPSGQEESCDPRSESFSKGLSIVPKCFMCKAIPRE